MNRIILLTLLSTQLICTAQDYDKSMQGKPSDCVEISYNSAQYYVKMMREEQIDSAKSILTFWNLRCGDREPIFRAKLLLALKTKSYTPLLINNSALNYLYSFKTRNEMIQQGAYYSYDNYRSYYAFIPPGQEFDLYTSNLAKELQASYPVGSDEYLLAEYYSGKTDSLLIKLQQMPDAIEPLKQQYQKAVAPYLSMSDFHFAFETGIWLPQGQLKQVGNHPYIGFLMGAKRKKTTYDIGLGFRFINASNTYLARRTKAGNNLEETRQFFGGQFSLDASHDIAQTKRNAIQGILGIAYEGFDALKENKTLGLEAESAGSFNFNFGLGYRLFYSNNSYIGIRAKYNILNYANSKVVNLSGNAFTLNLIIGNLDNPTKYNNLKSLNYIGKL